MHAPAHAYTLLRKAVQGEEGVGEADREAEEGGTERRSKGLLPQAWMRHCCLLEVTPGLCPPMDWHRHSVRMTEE